VSDANYLVVHWEILTNMSAFST